MTAPMDYMKGGTMYDIDIKYEVNKGKTASRPYRVYGKFFVNGSYCGRYYSGSFKRLDKAQKKVLALTEWLNNVRSEV